MISPVLTINAPMANKSINAIPTLPTSPAKHFALPLGLKLKNENTIREVIGTLSKITGKNISKEKEDRIIETILKDKVPKSIDKMF